MKNCLITFVILTIMTTITYFTIKNAINRRNKFHNEIIVKIETSKNEIINEVKSNSEKLDKLLENNK